MRYCVFDLETTVEESYKRTANPFDKRNKIIVAAKKYNDNYESQYNVDGIKVELDYDRFDVLIGQNIKFDLLYIWDDPKLHEWIAKGGKIFDTMLAEYLLTAQQSLFTSLDKLALKYGGTLKDDIIKEYYSAGFGADKIDPKYLLPYAKYDALNTELVAMSQLRQLKKDDLIGLTKGYMDHLLAIIEMEYNGMYLEPDGKVQEMRELYELKVEAKRRQLIGLTQHLWPKSAEDFNPNSVTHLKAVLYGAPLKVKVRVPTKDKDGNIIHFGPNAAKAGEIKSHLETRELKIDPPMWNAEWDGRGIEECNRVLFGIGFSLWDGRTKGASEKDFEDLIRFIDKWDRKAPLLKEFISVLLDYREHKKVLTTYLYGCTDTGKETGLMPLIMLHDNCIHHTLETVATKTGRLSSKNPNAQNMPPEIRTLFTSRFGETGKIVALDYSQLEVVVQAYLAQSPKMIDHIKQGVDFHCKRVAYAEELSYEQVIRNLEENPGVWREKRQRAKVVSYQKAYGSHPEKIAKEAGLDVATVEKIFKSEDEEYPEVQEFNNLVMQAVMATRIPNGTKLLELRDKDHYNAPVTRPNVFEGIGFYQGVTGKKYHFIERGVVSEKLRANGKEAFIYFKTTQIANYPVQGTAADIVALSVARVHRYLEENPELKQSIKLVNEVHDELVLDVDWGVNGVKEGVDTIQELLKDIEITFKHYLGIDFNVPLGVEFKVSDTWSK